MPIQQRHTAYDLGTKFWEIRNKDETLITFFNHNRFPEIMGGAEVYFMDLDLDSRLCENVQSAVKVDKLIKIATPETGIESEAEQVLWRYVMMALLSALQRQGKSQKKYEAQLEAKMGDIRERAKAGGSSMTVELLATCGID
ncbi:MAG: hypothetical protein BA863_07590 [Desulfovibrio sp. S3730MH75]|nr:MAG: hypothetical protein BA863_07590 [Desulfovibrio sp. S3730MH75]